MKTTTYICDRCKQSKSQDDIVPIELSYQISRKSTTNRYNHRASCDICKQCLDKLGLLAEYPEENPTEQLNKNNKTFETKLVDLLSDLGVLFEE